MDLRGAAVEGVATGTRAATGTGWRHRFQSTLRKIGETLWYAAHRRGE